MAQKIDAMWDDSPVDVTTEVNFIWSIADELRGSYCADKYKTVNHHQRGWNIEI
jgi:type I restriction enzyme M protein